MAKKNTGFLIHLYKKVLVELGQTVRLLQEEKDMRPAALVLLRASKSAFAEREDGLVLSTRLHQVILLLDEPTDMREAALILLSRIISQVTTELHIGGCDE